MVRFMGIKAFIMNKVKKVVFGYRATSGGYLAYLRKKGAKIGKNITIFAPASTTIDAHNPYLITMGDNIVITGPVTILTHDYAVFVCNNMCPQGGGGKQLDRVGCNRPVAIGNNVFLGWGCTILAGSTIGDNVIIGAHAVVSGKVESNSVYAGNPAKKIMSIEEYYERRFAQQPKEIEDMFTAYKQFYGVDPEETVFSSAYRNHFHSKGNGKRMAIGRTFESYEEFCDYMNKG